MKKQSAWGTFFKGILTENPVFVLVLGTCPALATTKTVVGALGMGLATTAVLICSNTVISLLRKLIPSTVRIPSYIILIAGFVTVVQLLVQAFVPSLYDLLGVYLPLITVNCIILGRAELFAGKNNVGRSVLDGAGMGIGFTLALLSMAAVRELLGNGSFAGIAVPVLTTHTISFFSQPPGGLLVYGVMIAIVNGITKGKAPRKTEFSCAGCPSACVCHGQCETKEEA